MGAVSGISDSGGVHHPHHPTPDYVPLKRAVSKYFEEPTEENHDHVVRQMGVVLQQHASPTLPYPQRKRLQYINDAIFKMKDLGAELNKLLQEPPTPEIQAEIEAREGKWKHLQTSIQEELDHLA